MGYTAYPGENLSTASTGCSEAILSTDWRNERGCSVGPRQTRYTPQNQQDSDILDVVAREEANTLSTLRERGHGEKTLAPFLKSFAEIRDEVYELNKLDRNYTHDRTVVIECINRNLASIRAELSKIINEPLPLRRRIWRRLWRK